MNIRSAKPRTREVAHSVSSKQRSVSRSQPKKISVPSTVKINTFISKHSPSTPFLVVDLEVVAAKYADMRRTMPRGDIFYAVKANPAPEVLSLLAGLGSNFDVASPGEIDLVLAAGATPERISYGNTIKKEADIAYAYAKGVRLFAFDSENELQKLSRSAPNAHVFCRILTTCDGADWPLSRKFGCELDMASTLLKMARDLKLQPRGVSFHVGSQQTRLDQWDRPLEQAAQLFRELRDSGITLDLVNIGGGLPAQYRDKIESIDSYAAAIRAAFSKYFGDDSPRIIIEPGRSLVGDSGILEAEVVLVSKKSSGEDVRWVYLDVGKFGGLAETLDEAIKYKIEVVGRKGATGPVIIAGPSCDSADILYEKFRYELPLSLKAGDRVRIHTTGAYTTTYSSVGFNGFEPLKTHCI